MRQHLNRQLRGPLSSHGYRNIFSAKAESSSTQSICGPPDAQFFTPSRPSPSFRRLAKRVSFNIAVATNCKGMYNILCLLRKAMRQAGTYLFTTETSARLSFKVLRRSFRTWLPTVHPVRRTTTDYEKSCRCTLMGRTPNHSFEADGYAAAQLKR